MVRISKQSERRARFPRKHRPPSPKTGPLKDNLKKGFKEHPSALDLEPSAGVFIAKIR